MYAGVPQHAEQKVVAPVVHLVQQRVDVGREAERGDALWRILLGNETIHQLIFHVVMSVGGMRYFPAPGLPEPKQ